MLVPKGVDIKDIAKKVKKKVRKNKPTGRTSNYANRKGLLIEHYINAEKKTPIKELAVICKVSERTIKRDLARLREELENSNK